MKPAELLATLEQFHREKLELLMRHVAGARRVPVYEINNTYQYVIARDDLHLDWLRSAIEEMGGGGLAADAPEPELPAESRAEVFQAVLAEDVAAAQAFVDRWQERVEGVSHARHKIMLRVILGETLEQKRFFEQALAGRTDLLGRNPGRLRADGAVLPTRWVE